MRAFEVHLNGKRWCLAGLDDPCVLTAIATYLAGKNGRDLFLRVGGLDSATNEHVDWKHRKLRVGDEVRLRIVNAKSVDRPRKRYRADSVSTEALDWANALSSAKKYGWELKKSKKR